MELYALFAVLEWFAGHDIGDVHIPAIFDPWPLFELGGEVMEFWGLNR